MIPRKTCKNIATGQIHNYKMSVANAKMCKLYPVGKLFWTKMININEFNNLYIDLKVERKLKLEKINDIEKM